MANKTIPQLPEQTGKTNDDLLVIVDSGETTTSKIKVSTLLDGVGGGEYISGNGTNNIIPNYYDVADIIGTGNTIAGGDTTTKNTITNSNSNNNFIAGGTNNTIDNQDSAIIGGTNNTIQPFSSTILGGSSVIAGGNTNTADYQENFIGGGRNNSVGFGGYRGNAIVGSEGCSTSSRNNLGIYSSVNSSITGGGSQYSSLLGGTSNSITGRRSSIIGGTSNTITHNRSVILGGASLTTSYDDEVVCEHITTSGQSRGNFYNNLSGDTFTIDWNEGNLQKIYMTGDTALTFSNVKNGATYKLQVENGGTHAITGITATGFTILCEGGSIPNITNSGVDMCVLEVMGTDILVRHFAAFATP